MNRVEDKVDKQTEILIGIAGDVKRLADNEG